MLKLQFRDRRREAVWLVDSQFTIGRNAKNSLMISDPSVQEFHAEILNTENQLTIVDKSAGKALKVNNTPITGHANLKVNDTIQVGEIELELVDPKAGLTANKSPSNKKQQWSIASKASWIERGIYHVNQTTTIGRDPSCDICLPLDHLSRRHAELRLESGQLYIKDLNSSNGTFVNGQKITETALKPGDKIKLDVVTFDVKSSGEDPNKTIIRQAPEPSSEVQSKGKAKSKPKPSTANKQAVAQRKNANIKKKLAAEGKQDWLSGAQQENKPTPSRAGVKVLMLGGIILMTAAVALLLTKT